MSPEAQSPEVNSRRDLPCKRGIRGTIEGSSASKAARASAVSRRAQQARKKEALLEELIKTGGNVSLACHHLGIGRNTVYNTWLKKEDYRERFEESRKTGGAYLEEEARRRAVDGVEIPIVYQGETVGYTRKYSDSLLMFLLKGIFPEKYRETHRGSREPIPDKPSEKSGHDLSLLTNEELETLDRIMAKAERKPASD